MKPLIDQLQERVPGMPVSHALIAANVLVFVAMLFNGAGLIHSANGIQLAWGANFGPATQDGEWWRLATAMFLHFGILHLALNMVALWDAGAWVERMYGHGRFVLLYFGAGLFGNVCSIVFQKGQVVSGGASGAIFGLYGALLAYLWLRRREIHPGEFRRLFVAALFFSALTIGFGLVASGIDNAAHLGGLVGGLLLGVLLAPTRPRWQQRAVPAMLMAVMLVLLLINMPEPRYRWHDEQQARKEIGEFLREDAAITRDWNRLIEASRHGGISFDDLAQRIETDVTGRYDQSFEELAALPNDSALPSAAALERLRSYAEERREASRELAEGLRQRDARKIREALERARKPAAAP
jgi:rhomboid protease GluP